MFAGPATNTRRWSQYWSASSNPWKLGLLDNLSLDKVIKKHQVEKLKCKHIFRLQDSWRWRIHHVTGKFIHFRQCATCVEHTESNNEAEKSMDNHQLHQTEKEDEYLNEEGIENFLENGNIVAHEGNAMNTESIIMPHLGMEFNTREGQEFFNFYSNVAGFSVAIVAASRTANKKRNNEYKRITMKCNKHGKTKEVERESIVPIRRTTVIAKS